MITDANSLIWKIDDLVSAVVWLLVSLAVIFIVWNAVQFIRHSDDAKRKESQMAVIRGIVGLAVILSIWGLVYILRNTFWTDDIRGEINAQGSINNLILKNPSRPSSPGAD